jgi:ATP/maltotriose-dependent transcriptional regulator MalT
LLLLLKWLELRYIIADHSLEVYIGCIALLFTGLGIWLAIKLMKPKPETFIIEKEVFVGRDNFVFNAKAFERSGLSKRELEVLQLMSQGHSNAEIAERLFVSLNTIKTHSSNIFLKLDAKRRTQAIEIAKKLSLIP